MSKQSFKPLLPSVDQRPKSAFSGLAGYKTFLRDQLTISTWLSLGALAQGVLFLLAGRIALLPAFLTLCYRIFSAYAMSVGWMHNTYMDGVLPQKISAQFPDDVGDFGNKPSSNDITVLIIGTRANHPMGIFAPGFKQLGDYFVNMIKSLEEHPEEFGFLGATNWLNASARETSSENMTIIYFRTTEQLHAFAHSKYHTEGWDWWNKEVKKYPHLGIYHEVYHAPKGHWENIYHQMHATGVASSTMKYFDSEKGEERWMSPIVDASKGILKTSGGRMGAKATERDGGVKDAY